MYMFENSMVSAQHICGPEEEINNESIRPGQVHIRLLDGQEMFLYFRFGEDRCLEVCYKGEWANVAESYMEIIK